MSPHCLLHSNLFFSGSWSTTRESWARVRSASEGPSPSHLSSCALLARIEEEWLGMRQEPTWPDQASCPIGWHTLEHFWGIYSQTKCNPTFPMLCLYTWMHSHNLSIYFFAFAFLFSIHFIVLSARLAFPIQIASPLILVLFLHLI